jgi:hypothetical protein
MQVAGQNTAAPEVSLPLAQKGWPAIRFGLRGGPNPPPGPVEKRFDVFADRASSGRAEPPGRVLLALRRHHRRKEIVLRQLTVRTVTESRDSPANFLSGDWLAYIRLVPFAEREVKTRPGTRRLLLTTAPWSYTFTYRPATEPEIRRELETFRDTDFSRIYKEGGVGDRMYYPTRLGLTAADDSIEDPCRAGDRLRRKHDDCGASSESIRFGGARIRA